MKQTAQTYKALSDETRLRILGLLLNGELCVCELMGILNLPQSTVSRHLAYLKNSGLVSDQRRGTWMHYSLVNGETIFHRELFDFLKKTLLTIPEVSEDQQKLLGHPLRRTLSACCKKVG